ncbi:hypothetical protein EDC01DRAFT_125913 [Geopyxis carbonaria]|nr:hypothetical protein EDC01DRAFT_125913 [Geopyxis carbonaria]
MSQGEVTTTILLGAPILSDVDLNTLELIDYNDDGSRNAPLATPPDSSVPTWRRIQLDPQQLKTGFTQPTLESPVRHTYEPAGTSFLSTGASTASTAADSTSFLSTGASGLSQSFLSTASTAAPPTPPRHPALPPLISLTELEDLPSARTVAASPPYSHRLTAIVSILSISAPRTITTRFSTTVRKLDLVVGDPTAVGFPITVWRPAAELEALRVQDVIVVRNINLKVFNSKVVGETVRREPRPSAIVLLQRLWCVDREERRRWRRRWDEEEMAERKVKAVVKWTREFVDPPGVRATEAEAESALPEDTQIGGM